MGNLASLELVKEIRVHPNANRLEFAEVLGYSCLVPKGRYSQGDIVLLIQPDSVLPDAEWTAVYKKHSSKRVKAQKFRGHWSFGIVESAALVVGGAAVGEDVSARLGIIKYEAPAPQELNAKGVLPFGMPKTDEERYQSFENLDAVMGSIVDVTLKVDGQSFTAYYDSSAADPFGVCGRAFEYKLEFANRYTAHIKRYALQEKLAAIYLEFKKPFAIRGESYGPSIQGSKNNPYSQKENGLVFFSVYLLDEKRYTDPGEAMYVQELCRRFDLPGVPVLERQVELTRDLIRKYDEELETVHGEPFEGVVIKGKGFSFKVINKAYDAAK